MSTKLLDPLDRRLAERLMAERQARGWSLADLAAKSGVSRAMISRVERGESSPTAALLGRLSGAFGLSLSRLLARAEAGSGSGVTRAGEQALWRDPATGFRRLNLTPAIEGAPPLELIGAELPPGAEIAYPASAYAFLEDQQILILSGRLHFRQGAKVHELGAGDCLRLGPPSDCVFANPGKVVCRYVVAVLSRRDRP
jgi:transcriptional regulator with XRE-family HTH domain